MPPAEIELTTRRPEPPEADFAFYIDFKRGGGSASRVFSGTHDFIRACERLDRELVSSIDASIETVMVLEDIEAGSLKTILRNSLNAVDDQALKDLDWRPLVGKYLVRAKFAVLRWIDDDSAPRDLPALSREIQKLASDTDVRHLPDYTPVGPAALLRAMKDFQGVKDHFVEGDKISVTTSDDGLEMNLSVRWDVDDIEALAVRETQSFDATSIVLIVKKPDYLGTSMWDLRHGRRTIAAIIEDKQWLASFQSRKVDVRPGDALRCQARIDMLYGHDNELIAERYTVLQIHEVLENKFTRDALFDEEDK